MGALTRYLTSPSIPMVRSPGGLWPHSDPLLNKPFYPNGLVTGILTWCQSGLGFESRRVRLGGYGRTLTRYLTSPSIPMVRSPGGLWAHSPAT
ncbi:unnamed protein product [Closterium sp. NIES-54]